MMIIIAHGQHHDGGSPRDPYSQRRLLGGPLAQRDWKGGQAAVNKEGKDVEGPRRGGEGRGGGAGVAARGDGEPGQVVGLDREDPRQSLGSFGRKPTLAHFSQEGYLQEGDGRKEQKP